MPGHTLDCFGPLLLAFIENQFHLKLVFTENVCHSALYSLSLFKIYFDYVIYNSHEWVVVKIDAT